MFFSDLKTVQICLIFSFLYYFLHQTTCKSRLHLDIHHMAVCGLLISHNALLQCVHVVYKVTANGSDYDADVSVTEKATSPQKHIAGEIPRPLAAREAAMEALVS